MNLEKKKNLKQKTTVIKRLLGFDYKKRKRNK